MLNYLLTTILELLSLRVPWEYGQHSTHYGDTAAVYVLLLDQIEKKETLLAILLNDLEFQNK